MRSVVFSSRPGPSAALASAFESQEARPLAGTEGAVFPFWAPDGRSIAFTAAGTLKTGTTTRT